MKKGISVLVSVACLLVVIIGIGWLFYQVWGQLKLLEPPIVAALLTTFITVLGATVTVVIGKSYDRKKDIEAHYRSKKVEIYDEFLRELFKIMFNQSSENGDTEDIRSTEFLVEFLREWQRKMILWGGQEVLRKYILWISHLKKGINDLESMQKSMLLMEKFFLEIRKDLGHKNSKLEEGTFIGLILRNPNLLMEKAKENPSLTLEEFSQLEDDFTV